MKKLTISQILVLGFASVIFIGGVLLWLPFSGSGGIQTKFIDALFTSTSAVCVTGLVVVDTGSHFSRLGHVIIMLLIQVGGLGIMTFSLLAVILMGGHVSHRFQLILKEALNRVTIRDIVSVAKSVVMLTFMIEAVGMMILFLRWRNDLPPLTAAFYSLFHSISAFCNAGFALFSDNIASYVGDPTINLTMASLIISGGIGFTVLIELTRLHKIRRLSVHSKLALSITAVLIFAGMVGLYFCESLHSAWFRQDLTPAERLFAAFFQSVSARTAGFNTIDIGAMSGAGLLLIIILMFIGASPGGTGGGIKTTTFGAVIASLVAMVKGEKDVQVFNRRIPQDTLQKALTIGLISTMLVTGMTLLMLLFKQRDFMKVLFEVVSAFGTVGYSTGITPDLTLPEKIIIIITMFCGRLGPLTMAVALAESRVKKNVRVPEGGILIG